MVAGALDEGRIGGFERQHAMLCQIYRILESGAKDNGHDLVWGWPLLGLSDPDARPDVHWSPAEASAVIAWHREAAALETAKKQLMTPIGKATPKVKSELSSDDDDNLQKQIRAVVKQTLQAETARTGRQGREGQRRLGELRPGRHLHECWSSSPSRSLHGASRDTKTDGLCFLHCCPPFPRKRSSRNLSATRSPQLVPVTTPGGVGSQRQAAPRHHKRCNCHEVRAGTVALILCCLVQVSNGGLGPPDESAPLPAWTQH